MTIIMGRNKIVFIGATKVEEPTKWKNMLREIMEFLVQWNNLLTKDATWKDAFSLQKIVQLIKH
jgi:hypothetical protein